MILLLAVFLLFCQPSFVWAVDASATAADVKLFKTYNADIDKYAFTRSFIMSVGNYKRVADRLMAEGDIKAKRGADQRLILKYIEDRTLDNTELRIARNYLTRFVKSRNGLIQKVSRQAVMAYDRTLALSMRERDLWQVFYRFKMTGLPEDFNEPQLVEQLLGIFAEKKETDKNLLSASMLIRILLLSGERCDGEACKNLALTADERHRLVGYLDDFARDNTAWGIKAGQSPVEGCVAAIREVLEDQIYSSRDQ